MQAVDRDASNLAQLWSISENKSGSLEKYAQQATSKQDRHQTNVLV